MAIPIPILGSIVEAVIDVGKRLVPDRAAAQAANAASAARQQEIDAALHQKQVEAVAQATSYEAAWNLAQANNSATSWKDEYWTIVLSIPMISVFIPGLVPYVQAGFKALNDLPGWYQEFIGVAISAAFGLQQANKIFSWWQKP